MNLLLFLSNARVLLSWYYWQTITAIQNFMKLVCARNVDCRVEIRVETKMKIDIEIPKNKI